jgi:Zn-dependent protease with chaperone function
MHNGIQLGPRQLPSLWRMVHSVAERFGMPAPLAYVTGEGGANAFAFGVHRHSIGLTSGLIDLMSDRELEAIIAHELGHVMCQHMLYRQVGVTLSRGTTELLAPFARLSPAALNGSFAIAFMCWSRAAEYTADRAALLMLRDAEALASCLSRLAGVPRRFAEEFDPRQFAEQVAEYEQEATFWSTVVTWDLGLLRTHPEPAKRAVAVLEWADSEEYRRILAGHFPTRFESEHALRPRMAGVRECPLCHSPVGDQQTCPYCTLALDPSRQSHCRRGHLVSVGWKFCLACGEPLAEPGAS